MCITPSECLVRLGDFGQYCPVSLADRGELVDCSVNPSLEFAAEFRGRYYKMASRVELELFLADPTRYVPPLAPRKLPDLELLPKRRTAAEVKTMFPKQIELKGYCPVTYLDGKLRWITYFSSNNEKIQESSIQSITRQNSTQSLKIRTRIFVDMLWRTKKTTKVPGIFQPNLLTFINR